LIKAKKSLGQNFLIDQIILNKIVDLVNIQNKAVLEIGPGTGNLTCHILKKKPKKLIVIEKDNVLAFNLQNKFNEQINILNKDVLEVDELLLCDERLTVFGNLPYNISTEILSKWIKNIDSKFWFDGLVLMFQKEVADRIIAKFNTANYGRLTILSNWKLNIKKIMDVDPESFSPKPKIKSTILLFVPKNDFYEIKDPKNLETITRIFFNHRRKMLKKPFNQIFNGNKKILEKFNFNLDMRPQNLDCDTYYKLAQEYEKLTS
jgi:16S rRNA (adenine1518-N6/adenine1519-N6)-dimethyltransferase